MQDMSDVKMLTRLHEMKRLPASSQHGFHFILVLCQDQKVPMKSPANAIPTQSCYLERLCKDIYCNT